MKGPAFQYEVRILRLFRCRRCGKTLRVPGSVASHICRCSDPPTFMTLVDPPKVVSPDVSQFLSTPDPAELAAAEIPETDEPLGPWVSRMPVRPPQHPNRRKLSDEFEKHIGDGDPEAAPDPETAHLTVSQNEYPPTQREHSDRRDHNDRRDRRDRRDRGDRRDGRDRRDRGARMDRPDSRQTDSAPEPGPSAPAAEQANTSQSAHSGAAPADHGVRPDQPHRGEQRERGRRPDRRDRGPRPDRNPGRPPQRNTPHHDPAPRQQSTEDFGDGIDEKLPTDTPLTTSPDDQPAGPENSAAAPDQARSRRRRRRR
ncbi:MAG: hypothetical protein ACK5YO_24475 [Planctomyces sp.]